MVTSSQQNGPPRPERTPEEVADLLDAVAAAELSSTVAGLEGLLRRLRPALDARDALLDGVSPRTLRRALELRASRRGHR